MQWNTKLIQIKIKTENILKKHSNENKSELKLK